MFAAMTLHMFAAITLHMFVINQSRFVYAEIEFTPNIEFCIFTGDFLFN